MKLADAFGIMGRELTARRVCVGPSKMRLSKTDRPYKVTVGEMPSTWQYMPLVRKDKTPKVNFDGEVTEVLRHCIILRKISFWFCC